jgi:hypothetical protein
MKLLYDPNDLPYAKKLRDERFRWLIDMVAVELSRTSLDEHGFMFAYQHGDDRYRRLVADRPHVLDRPEQRDELLCLDDVLQRLDDSAVDVPRPKTWVIGVDDALPNDLEFPLFVRTPKSSWKRGGGQSKVRNVKELNDESDLLRRAFGWNTRIVARKWIDVAISGRFMFGDAPQEVRVWIVDQQPVAWSFHYLHVVPNPAGFPPSPDDLRLLSDLATKIGSAFGSRLIAADFVRDRQGTWWFLEAGPGSVAGTAHKAVFKYVAERIRGGDACCLGDAIGKAF